MESVISAGNAELTFLLQGWGGLDATANTFVGGPVARDTAKKSSAYECSADVHKLLLDVQQTFTFCQVPSALFLLICTLRLTCGHVKVATTTKWAEVRTQLRLGSLLSL